ncbi:MAG: hypothetical protein AAFY56_23610 [Pseudomonadota bacterium]
MRKYSQHVGRCANRTIFRNKLESTAVGKHRFVGVKPTVKYIAIRCRDRQAVGLDVVDIEITSQLGQCQSTAYTGRYGSCRICAGVDHKRRIEPSERITRCNRYIVGDDIRCAILLGIVDVAGQMAQSDIAAC